MRKIIPVAVITVVVLGTVLTLNKNQLISIPPIFPEATESKPAPVNQPSVHHYDTVLKQTSIRHVPDGKDLQLSSELENYIKKQQMQAADIPYTNNGDGTYTVHVGNQFSTVTMAVIDKNGKTHIVERQIQPIGTVELTK